MKTLIFEKKQDYIWQLSINRPEALNALNSTVLDELTQVLEQISTMKYSEIRCLIITGSGEKSFVAGADIKELSTLDSKSAVMFSERGQKIFRQIENLKIPVIAAVNGFALGGGLELALSCDFIYASENAKFALPEVSLGLIPGFGGCVRLSRVVGLNRAREMTLSGDMINAQEAHQAGLVNKVLPLADLLSTALKTAISISSRGPIAVANAKKAVLESFDQNLDQGMQTEAKSFGTLFDSNDVKEGTLAFIEKRKAQFVGQ